MVFDAPINEEHTNYQEQIQSVFNGIDWKCKLKIMRNKTNLGYNDTMLKAVRWFFRYEEEGILLDGRSVPFPAFFAFCSCLLEKYRHMALFGSF